MICNTAQFNKLFALIDYAKDYKNTIYQYFHKNLIYLISDHKVFVSHYKFFDNIHLNSSKVIKSRFLNHNLRNK